MASTNRWRRWLARLAARFRVASDADAASCDAAVMARPIVRRGWRHTSLQFDRTDAQSRMLTFQPDRLLVDYTRTMMGALLFHPQPGCVGMIGLGGGSQLKFLHRHFPGTRIEVAEINPQVIALRRRFRVPDDDARLEVLQADGAEFVARRPGRYDVLLVDGYDTRGIPPALSTARFYRDCRDALAPGGVMVSNLYCADADRHVNRLQRCFGGQVLVIEESQQSNRVAFAWREGPLPSDAAEVERRLALLPAGARAVLAPVFERLGRALADLPG